jgi:hypothetical protein
MAVASAVLLGSVLVTGAGGAAAAGPTTVSVTTFETATATCKYGQPLPDTPFATLQTQVLEILGITCPPLPTLLPGATAAHATASPQGTTAVDVSAAGSIAHLFDQFANAFGQLWAAVPVTTPVSSVEVTLPYAVVLARTATVPNPNGLPNDQSFATARLSASAPACTSGHPSSLVLPVDVDTSATGALHAVVTCSDGSQIGAGNVSMSVIVSVGASSFNGGSQHASGSVHLGPATVTLVP